MEINKSKDDDYDRQSHQEILHFNGYTEHSSIKQKERQRKKKVVTIKMCYFLA